VRSPIYLIISVILTLFIQLGFWQVTSHWSVKPIKLDTEEAKRKDTKTIMTMIDLNEFIDAPKPKPLDKARERVLTNKTQPMNKLVDPRSPLGKPNVEVSPIKSGIGTGAALRGSEDGSSDTSALPGNGRPLAAPPPRIIEIKARDLPVERLLDKRRITPTLPRQELPSGPLLPSVASPIPGTGDSPLQTLPIDGGLRVKPPPRPKTLITPPAVKFDLSELRSVRKEDIEAIADTNVLDHALQADFHTYRAPSGETYFRIDVRTNEGSDRIVPMPKDVLILQDASASIGHQKMTVFRKGLSLALDYLLPTDRFNLVAFRNDVFPAFEQNFVEATPDNIATARKFAGKLRSTGKTDVFNSLVRYVETERPDPNRPYIIYLVTDGRSTTGEELENSEFIRRIIERNKAEVSIFSFSAGEKTNLFLVNYLSYKNRGLSVHENKLESTPHRFASYFGNLSEVLVADLHYRISGDAEYEMYPRELPHLFRSSPLTIYGRAPAGAETVDIQVVGRNQQGKREELIIQRKLSESAAGGPALVTGWAAQKIYHLIAERSLNKAEGASAEIERLAKEYGIEVPY
jgi:hypothetical protein